jgi:hypothetical protein
MKFPRRQFLHLAAGAVALPTVSRFAWAQTYPARPITLVALFALYYNFVRIHKTLRTTPAMAANVTKRLWEIGDIVDVLEAWEAAN